MSPIHRIKVLTTLVLALAVAGALSGMGHVHAAEEKAAQVTEDVYYCPMHPQVVSDKPGDCPICHMRLVKRGSEEKHVKEAQLLDPKAVCMFHDCPMEKDGKPCPMLVIGSGNETVSCPVCSEKIKVQGEALGDLVPAGYSAVLISPQKQQLIGVRTALVVKKVLKQSLMTVARVAYDPELYEAQIEYLREYREAQGTLRNRELAFKNLLDSRWEAPRLEIARSKLVLKGMDDESMARLVQAAKADEALLYLDADGPVWVYVDVFESEVGWIHKGDTVRVEVPSTGRTYEGKIDSVGAIIDPDTRRVRALVLLQNDGTLKPQMLLNAVIESGSGEGLAVPAEAVFFTGTAAVVFLDRGQGLFEPRQVQVGMKLRGEYQVLSGLSEGDRVVVNGNFLLDSESRLKASIDRAASAHAGHGGGS